MIEAAFQRSPSPGRVLDLGTGSGALLLAMLANSSALGLGIDASEGACAVARKNAAGLGLSDRTDIRCASWLDDGWGSELGTFDLICAIRPYVESGAVLDPDVCDHEPASALFAGADGLDDYRLLIPQISQLLGLEGLAIFEIGHTQADAVTALANVCGYSVRLHRDLAERPRALALEKRG